MSARRGSRSRLAARVAARYPGGVIFCDLAPTHRAHDVARTIARAIGLRESAHSKLESQLVECLSNRRALVVLDNCEHVLEPVTATVARLVQSTEGTVVLATSRERLGLDGENVWLVDPLPAASDDTAAVELFIDRASLVTPRFVASQADVTVIRQICTRLDGLPLAIEMAAARAAALRLEDLLHALDDRFELLHASAASRTASSISENGRRMVATRSWSRWSSRCSTRYASSLVRSI